MKVTHPSGQDYDLYPNMKIEVTRYNPFFHELGEQSVPVSIPATPKNLQLLGYPDRLDSINKPVSRLDTTIQSGAYSIVGRQAILSAQRKGSIETSFYFNEGAFYEKISDITLSAIFAGKKLEFPDIDATISFMYSLVSSVDPRFCVFPVVTDNYTLNGLSQETTPGGLFKFVKEVETVEVIDDKNVKIPKGFYITPFVKVKHVLEEVFAFMGYALNTSFLDTSPFNEMVFLNDNLDTIVNNSIHYVDIVPDITVKDLLSVIRKFNIEFVPDEAAKKINILRFDQALQDPPYADLTPNAVSIPIINYHNEYKQVKLTSKQISLPDKISTISTIPPFNRSDIEIGLAEEFQLPLVTFFATHPTAFLRPKDGAILRIAVVGAKLFTEQVSSLSAPYYAGENMPELEYSFPDVIPGFLMDHSDMPYLYVGKGRALQSKIIFSQSPGDEDSEDGGKIDNSKLQPMLALCYRDTRRCFGTLSNFDHEGNRLWDHSIMWNGEAGIYEKFWRKRDELLRNALLEVTVDLLLPEDLKLSIPSTRKVSLNSQNLFISGLKYDSASNSSGSCTLLSTKLQTPVSAARPISEYFRDKKYKWIIKVINGPMGPPYDPMTYRYITEPTAFYPPDPTPEQYAAGGKYYERFYDISVGKELPSGEWQQHWVNQQNVWLEPALA